MSYTIQYARACRAAEQEKMELRGAMIAALAAVVVVVLLVKPRAHTQSIQPRAHTQSIQPRAHTQSIL